MASARNCRRRAGDALSSYTVPIHRPHTKHLQKRMRTNDVHPPSKFPVATSPSPTLSQQPTAHLTHDFHTTQSPSSPLHLTGTYSHTPTQPPFARKTITTTFHPYTVLHLQKTTTISTSKDEAWDTTASISHRKEKTLISTTPAQQEVPVQFQSRSEQKRLEYHSNYLALEGLGVCNASIQFNSIQFNSIQFSPCTQAGLHGTLLSPIFPILLGPKSKKSKMEITVCKTAAQNSSRQGRVG
ncbi:hypothetical protein P171DRAFT_56590 [Karstenula rhodostoma CBS 690.94]|uniref:Uncharacterized protein n=1 Tax=Karstenula rhodostoma CBS 690.94 TaxID=1392251 RepID=A0A9P4PHN5_9PLEO|nr:hypothetical protein P171DRAFT_56590 [Karstenula rhodostoma CBS 690.94]